MTVELDYYWNKENQTRFVSEMILAFNPTWDIKKIHFGNISETNTRGIEARLTLSVIRLRTLYRMW